MWRLERKLITHTVQILPYGETRQHYLNLFMKEAIFLRNMQMKSWTNYQQKKFQIESKGLQLYPSRHNTISTK